MRIRDRLITAAISLLLSTATPPLGAQALQPPSIGLGDPPPGPPPGAMLKDDHAERISPHVWIIRGFPNVVIVVGDQASLVIDTGLGAVNGQVVARTVAKLARAPKLYLTTTHFHPEHAAGEAGFPAGTILIRARVQQEELEADHGQMLDMFRRGNPELLNGFSYRKPDRLFDSSERIDLGGVHALLIWAGPAHTRGDEEVQVEEDGVLVTGDVVQNKTGPSLMAAGVGPRDWLTTVDALMPLHPKVVIPDHSDPGPGAEMIQAEHDFLKTLDNRAHALKAAGVSALQAGTTITAEMRTKYPDWNLHDLSDAVIRAYAE